MTQRRAVVTGLGIVSAVGIGSEATWEALVAGRSGITDITLFDASPFDPHVAGEVKSFDATAYMDPKDARRHDRNTHFAVAATGEALRHAGLLADNGLVNGDVNADRFGMVVGTAIGGIGMMLDGHQTLLERGARRVSPFMLPHMLPDSASGQVAIQYGIRGPNMAVVSACATGGHAVGEAMEAIVRGQADIMLGAGTEAPLVPLAFAGFGQMRALGTPKDPDSGEYDPAMASRPFDATRDGFVVSEGAAVLVLEELEHALARGARPIAEVIGYGSSADAYDMAAPAERGEGAQRAMRAALVARRDRSGGRRLHQRPRHLHAAERSLRDDRHPRRLRRARRSARGQQHEVDDSATPWAPRERSRPSSARRSSRPAASRRPSTTAIRTRS